MNFVYRHNECIFEIATFKEKGTNNLMKENPNNGIASLKKKSRLILGDSEVVLPTLKQKFDLILTSPAYNINKEYETKVSIETYLEEQKKVIQLLIQTLNDNGSICWQVGNYIDKKNKELYPLDIYYYQIFKELGLTLKNRIVWKSSHGYHAKNKFSGRYETILWFVKGDDYIFNLDPVRVPQKYPGKKSYRGKNKGKYSGNPLGKNPSDIWEILLEDWEKEIWDIPNVKANHKEKTIHPCQFPIELAERCILALTNENSWVLDPYSGVGSSVLAAIRNNRNAIGIEKYKKYIDVALERISSLAKGNLKYRPLGTEVFKPDPERMSVARKPDHFEY